jgi:hypothetical protein
VYWGFKLDTLNRNSSLNDPNSSTLWVALHITLAEGGVDESLWATLYDSQNRWIGPSMSTKGDCGPVRPWEVEGETNTLRQSSETHYGINGASHLLRKIRLSHYEDKDLYGTLKPVLKKFWCSIQERGILIWSHGSMGSMGNNRRHNFHPIKVVFM